MITIRQATEKDIPCITEIYNDAIKNTTATFDTEIKSVENRLKWFNDHDSKHPIIVAELKGKVIGYASLSPWSDRCAYESTAEVSVYIDKNFRGNGTGKKLLEVITLEGVKCGLHNILSRISEGNASSIHIHELMGYEHIGVIKQAGKKFGKYLDVHMMQKLIGNTGF